MAARAALFTCSILSPAVKHPVGSVVVASRPTLLRHGLVTLLRERWPRLLFILAATAGQVAEQVARWPFDLLVPDEAPPERTLPELLARLRTSKRMTLLLKAVRSTQLVTVPLPWPGTRRRPHHVVLPELMRALASWLDPAAGAEAGPHRNRSQRPAHSARASWRYRT